MVLEPDTSYYCNGGRYVPFHSVPLAGGIFLSTSADSIDQYLELPPESEFRLGISDRYEGGVRMLRQRLSAARVRGNSMIDWDILDGDIVIFERWDFGYVENGKIVVIER